MYIHCFCMMTSVHLAQYQKRDTYQMNYRYMYQFKILYSPIEHLPEKLAQNLGLSGELPCHWEEEVG